MNRTGLVIGSVVAAALLAALAVGGVVRAQSPASGGSGAVAQAPASGPGAGFRAGMDNFLNSLAQNLGISRPTLDSALKTTAKQQVDSAVSAGRLTQDQANQIKQRIDSGQGPFGFGGFGFGRFGRGGPGGPGGAVMAACGSSVQQAVTSTLGVSADDLRQARRSGKTISQIAADHGKTVQDVQSAVSAAAKSCLDQQVAAGNLTADQEQNILRRIQNAPAPSERHGPGDRNRPHGGGSQ